MSFKSSDLNGLWIMIGLYVTLGICYGVNVLRLHRRTGLNNRNLIQGDFESDDVNVNNVV
jgi:hypothetical protein